MNQKELMIITATVFATVIAWVVFEVYSIRKQTPTQAQIASVNVNYVIDVTILEKLKERSL